MVSGWDRSPGPENDYTSRPAKNAGTLKFIILAGFAGVAYIALTLGWFR